MPVSSPWIVQKFGGTSIGKLLPTITDEIIPTYSITNNVAVVCSARSGRTKSSGTTSSLLRAAELAESPQMADEMNEVINTIMVDQLGAAREAVELKSLRDGLERDIVAECENLRTFLLATQIIGEVSDRSRDRVISTGEKLSAMIVEAALRQKGLDTVLITLNDIVTESCGNEIHSQKAAYEKLGPNFYHALARNIGKKLLSHSGKICVLPGFFGMMPYSLIKTVGRGYSDLCAAMCAVGIDAQELQIWKEVDGIFTADPSKVPSARLLATVTPEETMELTFYGSEVIHPLTMRHIQSADIPLRIKNVKNPNGPGTMIYPSENSSTSSSRRISPDRRAFMDAHGYEGIEQSRRTPTAITSKTNIIVLNISPNGSANRFQFMSEVIGRLATAQVVPDLMCTSEQSMSFAIHSNSKTQQTDILTNVGNVTVLDDMAIVSVIGHKMKNMVGIAGEILITLAHVGINIYLISQGASEVNISFVVKEEHVMQAINVIHSEILNIPETVQQTALTGKNGIRGPWLF